MRWIDPDMYVHGRKELCHLCGREMVKTGRTDGHLVEVGCDHGRKAAVDELNDRWNGNPRALDDDEVIALLNWGRIFKDEIRRKRPDLTGEA